VSDGVFIRYQEVKFSAARAAQLGRVNQIIDDYARQGLTMSVRQIYYQLVRRAWIDNEPREYDKLVALVSDGRMAGMISWTAIEDRNRQMMGLRTYDDPYQVLREAPARLRRDLWVDQDWRPKVLVEKAALEGVIGQVCDQLRVDFMATRGYNSQSETWRLGRELARCVRAGQRPLVLHLGDHDPSGLDMTRDLRDRLSLFASVPVLVQRLALNLPQVERYDPPPNPTKLTDSRAGVDQGDGTFTPGSYRDQMQTAGADPNACWELDALEPTVIRDLIQDAVLRVRDPVRWDAALAREAQDRDALTVMVEEMTGGSGLTDDDDPEENDDDDDQA
jgi:hypothetical protein